MSFPSYLPAPRLCRLKKWNTYSGYGFNLHAEKGKAGQYIGKVDPDSPAELGGLKTKDYLIEVNGTNVEDLTHQKVVERVKEIPDVVTMLVVDMETYKQCREQGIAINSDMPEVVAYFTPDTQPSAARPASGGSLDQPEMQREIVPQQQQQQAPPPASSPSSIRAAQQPHHHHQQQQSSPAAASASRNGGGGGAGHSKSNSSISGGGADPLANISLEEMRAKIGSNRRTQVKMNPSSFSEKYNMFQAL